MSDLNKVTLIGRLVRDPEIKYTTSGKPVSNFSIACSDGFGDVKKVYYFDIQAWDKQATNCEKYLKKGSQIAIDGKLIQQRWNDKDGKAKSKIVINAFQVKFLTVNTEKKENTQASGLTEKHQQTSKDVNQVFNDPWQES